MASETCSTGSAGGSVSSEPGRHLRPAHVRRSADGRMTTAGPAVRSALSGLDGVPLLAATPLLTDELAHDHPQPDQEDESGDGNDEGNYAHKEPCAAWVPALPRPPENPPNVARSPGGSGLYGRRHQQCRHGRSKCPALPDLVRPRRHRTAWSLPRVGLQYIEVRVRVPLARRAGGQPPPGRRDRRRERRTDRHRAPLGP